MGREVRRVPANWEHPKDEKGFYKPMYDHTIDETAQEWMEGLSLWQQGKHPIQVEYPKLYEKYKYYWLFAGNPPNPDCYRAEFIGPA